MSICIGVIEFRSISKGIEASNEMVKISNVEILMLKTTCIGKFFIIVTGEEAEVQASVQCGVELADHFLIDYCVISSISEDIIKGLKNQYDTKEVTDAMAIMETTNVCKGLKALDLTLKSGSCVLVSLKVAFTLGGKLVFMVTGPVSSLESGIQAALEVLEKKDLVNASILPSPSSELIKNLLK